VTSWFQAFAFSNATCTATPRRKEAYRLYLKNGEPVVDVMLQETEEAPTADKRILCRHPFISTKRAYVQPARVERLYHLVWDGADGGVPAAGLYKMRPYPYLETAWFQPFSPQCESLVS
jgi:hypothetical protein